MTNNLRDEDEPEELSQVYEILRKDLKMLIDDLYNGVSMWKTTSIMTTYLGGIGFLLAFITAYPQTLPLTSTYVAITGAVGLGGAALIHTAYTFRRYKQLRKKYSRLFEIASSLK